MFITWALIQSALELGIIYGIIALALFLTYSMLNVCDLSTDGCYTMGAAAGAVVALAGHPFLALFAAMAAGVLSGLVNAFLQTKMKVESMLAGIIVNTGLYTVNICIMGKSNLNMNTTTTVFSMMKELLKGTALESYSKKFFYQSGHDDNGWTLYGWRHDSACRMPSGRISEIS